MIKSLGKATDEELGGGGVPSIQSSDTAGTRTDVGPGNMGGGLRSVSNFLNATPGLHYIPQVAGDIYELGRGTAGLLGNTKGYGYKDKNTGDHVNVENPFRSEAQTAETRNPANLLGLGADITKEGAGVAATTYLPAALPKVLGATGASQTLAASHPIVEALGRLGLSGLLSGTVRGIGSENPTPGSVAGTAALESILTPIIGLFAGGYGTKGSTYNKMEQLAKDSDGKVSLKDVRTEVQATLKERMGDKYTLHKKEIDEIVRKLLEAPTGELETSSPQLSSLDLLTKRGDLSKAAQTNWVQQLLGSTTNPHAALEPQTAAVVKNVVSSHLKDITPGMNLADSLYGLYSNPLVGSPASWPLKITAGLGGLGAAGNLLKKFGVVE